MAGVAEDLSLHAYLDVLLTLVSTLFPHDILYLFYLCIQLDEMGGVDSRVIVSTQSKHNQSSAHVYKKQIHVGYCTNGIIICHGGNLHNILTFEHVTIY